MVIRMSLLKSNSLNKLSRIFEPRNGDPIVLLGFPIGPQDRRLRNNGRQSCTNWSWEIDQSYGAVVTSTEYTRAPGRPISFALKKAFSIIRRTIPKMRLDRPKIGRPYFTHERCGPNDWADGFWQGQLRLAFALTDDTSIGTPPRPIVHTFVHVSAEKKEGSTTRTIMSSGPN
jgi:hypothetical protein